MKCFFCDAGMATGASLFRINKTGPGIKGIWACKEHIAQTDAAIDPGVREIVGIIEKGLKP